MVLYQLRFRWVGGRCPGRPLFETEGHVRVFRIIQVNKVKCVLDSFEYGTRVVFGGAEHPNASNFELKSPTNMTLSERLLMVWKSEKFGFPFGQ